MPHRPEVSFFWDPFPMTGPISLIIPCWGDDEFLLSRAPQWAALPQIGEVSILASSPETLHP